MAQPALKLLAAEAALPRPKLTDEGARELTREILDFDPQGIGPLLAQLVIALSPRKDDTREQMCARHEASYWVLYECCEYSNRTMCNAAESWMNRMTRRLARSRYVRIEGGAQ